MAQLAQQSLSIPEIRGSNPGLGNEIFLISVNCYSGKTKIKKKRLVLARYIVNYFKIIHSPSGSIDILKIFRLIYLNYTTLAITSLEIQKLE